MPNEARMSNGNAVPAETLPPADELPSQSARGEAVTDDLRLLLEVMPERVRTAVLGDSDRQRLIEIVLDLGRPPEARFPGRVQTLVPAPVDRDELRAVVERVGRFGGDNRAGIERTLHRISAIRNRAGQVVGLTCRVGRAVVGTLDIVRDVIEEGASVLLLGRPGVGKTTLLREATRVLADELGRRVVVVDTSNEIAGDGDIPHPGIGRARRMQVPSPAEQHGVMIEAVENHMPEVIVIDEIGTGAEALAARTIAERGVQLVATAHGNTLENLLQNPTLADLVGGIHAVTLSDEEARRRGTQKTVLERKAAPTFDVVIEIRDKDHLAVHHGVAEVVDRFLRGYPLRPQQRRRTEDGGIAVADEEGVGPDASDDAEPQPAWSGHKTLKVWPYAVSRSRLERAAEELRVPLEVVRHSADADVLITTKAQARRASRPLREAERRGVRVEVIRSNTPQQLESFLEEEFRLGWDVSEEHRVALQEVEEALDEVLDTGRPAVLSPQDRHVRRLQHELTERNGLTSRSRGREPFRYLVIYPA